MSSRPFSRGSDDRTKLDLAKFDPGPFALETDAARHDFAVHRLVLNQAVHLEREVLSIQQNAIRVPFAQGLLIGFMSLHGSPALGSTGIRLHRIFTDVPDVSGIAGMQLSLDRTGPDLVLTRDPEKHPTVAGAFFRNESPLDMQFE